MKYYLKISLLLSVIFGALSCDPTHNEEATDLETTVVASTAQEKRNAVLEEYTGVRCLYCPSGHTLAQDLIDANPGKVVVLNIHTGYYADPLEGWPDFTTPFGEQLASLSGFGGYPAGSINRNLFPGEEAVSPFYKQSANSLALYTVGFAPAGAEIMTLDSPINLGFKAVFKASVRELSVVAEAYFSKDIPEGILLNVALLENKVIGKQECEGYTDNQYIHNHILRHLLTGQWGEQIASSDTKTGQRIQRTFTYTVPTVIKIENCDIAIFATQSDKFQIFTGVVKAFK